MSATQSAFKVEYIQPFVDSLKGLFVEHLDGDLTVGKPVLNTDGTPEYDISGVIAFTGTVVGRVVISFPTEVAEKLVKQYLQMDPIPEGMLEDCVGELANIIVGRAKSNMESYQIVISPPTVVAGNAVKIAPQRGAACISLPCTSCFGQLQLEISIVAGADV